MVSLEQVEKLREKANVSFEAAKAALEATGGDLLEALILLERQGKVDAPSDGGGYYNSAKTAQEPRPEPEPARPTNGETFGGLMKRLGRFCSKLLHKGNTNTFEVYRYDQLKANLPITALVLMLVFMFWITIPLLIVGLFFNFHYRFSGPDLGRDDVNNAMNSASKAAEDIKRSVQEQDNQNK